MGFPLHVEQNAVAISVKGSTVLLECGICGLNVFYVPGLRRGFSASVGLLS